MHHQDRPMSARSAALPQLVAADGRLYTIALGRTTIGRDAGVEIRLTDDIVSGRHAALALTPIGVVLTDLHSTNGTVVNGQRVDDGGSVALRDGDVVLIGGNELHFASAATEEGELPMDRTRPADIRFTAGQQRAGQINNVAGDQHLQAIYAQRESFLREIAASRTRAKRLVWLGFLLFALGGGAFAWMVIRFISKVGDLEPGEQPSIGEVWGERVGGIPVGLIGWAVGAVGALMMVVGVVLHVMATSRQRRTVSQPVALDQWGGQLPSARRR
jgi:FHA domain